MQFSCLDISRIVPGFETLLTDHMPTFTGGIGAGSKWLLDRIVGILAATGVNPNFLTFLGLVVNFGAAVSFAVGGFRTGALITFFAGFLDARAESLIPLCKVGFMERPERLVLLIIGGLFNRMGAVLWVIAVVSTITVIHRIVYTWQETRAGRTLPGIKLTL